MKYARKGMCVNSELLKEKVVNSGLKTGFIVEKLGLSRQGFYNKLNGYTPFTVPEVYVLCSLLSISDEDSIKIFYPKSNLEVDKEVI